VRENLETWLEQHTEHEGFSVPDRIEVEFRRYLWAALLARIYEVLPLICPHCGAEMRMIAAITERPTIERILLHIGQSPRPLPIPPARGPPETENPRLR